MYSHSMVLFRNIYQDPDYLPKCNDILFELHNLHNLLRDSHHHRTQLEHAIHPHSLHQLIYILYHLVNSLQCILNMSLNCNVCILSPFHTKHKYLLLNDRIHHTNHKQWLINILCMENSNSHKNYLKPH